MRIRTVFSFAYLLAAFCTVRRHLRIMEESLPILKSMKGNLGSFGPKKCPSPPSREILIVLEGLLIDCHIYAYHVGSCHIYLMLNK